MVLNTRVYPFVQNVQDPHAQSALRMVWDRVHDLTQTVKGPPSGTLNPNQKPVNLAEKDAGITFYSTDFNRSYQWTGTTWTDAPGAPARNHTAKFLTSPDPPVGWAQCNGQATQVSTSDGRTEYFQTPVIPVDSNGLFSWVRL